MTKTAKTASSILAVVFLTAHFARAATVNMTPEKFQSVLYASSPGDTISFAPGTYNIRGTPANPAGGFTSGRIYVGNGAILSNGDGNGAINFNGLANVDFSGFVLDGVQIRADNARNLKIHDNTFQNISSDAITQGGMHDAQIVHNKFLHVGGQGVYGYPGDNVAVSSNTFDYVWEPIHFAASSCANLEVSSNVITNAIREGIELQCKVTSLKVNNNWVGEWAQGSKGNGHMGLSIATGFGGNIDISGNTILQSGPGADPGNGCAIESFGHNITIGSNYSYGWSCLILNGSEPGGLSSTNNTVVGGKLTDYDNVGGAYQIGPVNSTGDKLYAPSDPSAPPWPAIPGAPATQPATLPAGCSATPDARGQVVVVAPAGTAISIYASSLAPSAAVPLGLVPAAGTLTVGGIPNSWRVSIVAGSDTLPSVQVSGSPIPASGAFAPVVVTPQVPVAVVTPPPATEPTPFDVTVHLRSLDGKTWTASQ